MLNIYKPIGFTPYQTVQLVKQQYPQYANEKIGYAGRLDPMAEGVLLLLIGDENKNKIAYEQLEKEYIFEAVVGLETDSYDLLGKVNNTFKFELAELNPIALSKTMDSFKGQILQTYPPFSSVRVKGKPLLYWAFHNKLDTITIPQKKVTITNIQLLSLSSIREQELQKIIYSRIRLVTGNFRQVEILKNWETFFKSNTQREFPILKAKIHCSSGTYVRSLVTEIGRKLGSKATTVSIKRTVVGMYKIEDSLHLITEKTE